MEFIVMDSKKMPFSQGCAVKEILGMIGGKLWFSGYCPLESGTAIYVKSSKGGKPAESVWIDDGYSSAKCKYLNLGDGWKEKVAGEWVPAPGFLAVFVPEGVNVLDIL